MGDRPDLDEEAIVARIRERLRASSAPAPRGGISPRPQVAPDPSPAGIAAELATMREVADVQDAPLRSHGKLAPLVLLARRVARKMIAPSLERQVGYNLASHRLVTALHAEIESLKAEQQSLRRQCEGLRAQIEALQDGSGRR